MKIWAKVMKGDKILRDAIFEKDFALKRDDYIKALQEISYLLDIATPVSLPTHLKHFEKFNRVKYLKRDFIEDIDFDFLVLERVVEDKKKTGLFI